MRQIGLFGEHCDERVALSSASLSRTSSSAIETSRKTIKFYPEFFCWLSAAQLCVAHGYDPASIWWAEDRGVSRAAKKHSAKVQPDFLQEARAASCHSNEDRWALLYSILWRLNHDEPQLMELAGDPHIARMRKYSKAVSRDVHKMKAFVRFRKVDGNPSRYVSWFEPQHLIVEYAAPFFKRRFSNMNWSILTPVGCAHWEGQPCEPARDNFPGAQQSEERLWFSSTVDKNFAPQGDQFEEAWRVYYTSIFNPARLKVSAMQSEMPKKYWKNLPEAAEINALIQTAEERERLMIMQRKEADQLHCGTRPDNPAQLVQTQIQDSRLSPLQALKLTASLCTNCSQGETATQTVFGTGPEDATIMIVGEQPGDQEDLQGQPFVGPAGQVLSAALKRAGIDKEQCYLTNAVKHFGFTPRGKKRLHKKPSASVVVACGQWLQKELEIVDPEIVIYLGATAASTRFGTEVKISRDRGQVIQSDGRKHLITAHPSSILRLQQGATRNAAYGRFIYDLSQSMKNILK